MSTGVKCHSGASAHWVSDWGTLLVLSVVLASLTTAGAQAEPFPTGVYCSCPPTNDVSDSVMPGLADLGYVDGALVRLSWSDIEAAPGVYDWANLDRQFQLAADAGLGISLGIVNGSRAPAWLEDAGADYFDYDLRGAAASMPLPWDAVYLDAWDSFVQALGDRYGQSPTLDLVHVTHSTLNGFEMQLPSESAAGGTWQQAGYTTARHVDSWTAAIDSFAQAFPDTPLDVEVHPVLGPDDLRGLPGSDGDNNDVARQVIAYGLSTYPEQFGAFAAWWSLRNAEEVYPGMFEIVTAAADEGFAAVQLVGNVTNQPERYGGVAGAPPADLLELQFDESIDLALDNGVAYLEVWNADLFNPALADYFTSVHQRIHGVPEPAAASLLFALCLAGGRRRLTV